MSLTYFYEPFFSLSDFHRLFDDTLTSGPHNRLRSGAERAQEGAFGALYPKIDVHESKDNNHVTATFELPGLKKEDVTIDIHNNRLTVSGESASSTNEEKPDYVLRERRWGKFSRTVPLPSGTQPEQVKAKMENGVLTVTFPKTSAEKEAKRITID